MKKFTQEEVNKIYKEKGYNVISKYVGADKFLCVEKDGYKYSSTLKRFKNGEIVGTFTIKNKYGKENIEKFIRETINNGTIFLDAYNQKTSGKTRIKVDILCKCGNKATLKLESVLNGRCLCPKCCREQISEESNAKNRKKYIKRIEQCGYSIIDKDAELRANQQVEVIQKSTGYRVKIYPNTITKKTKPLIFSEYSNVQNYIYNINRYIELNNIPSKAISLDNEKNKNNRKMILFQCSCGNTYKTTLGHFMDGKIFCNLCTSKMSVNERMVCEYLNELNVNYQKEYVIDSCRYIKPLPFDFMISNNKLIEVQGEQHEKPIRFSSNDTDDIINKRFQEQLKRDNIKREFCKKHNIKLLEIWYYDIKNGEYKDKIKHFISA
jgi:uncharacterized Zn finger protein (UPF0148 family)